MKTTGKILATTLVLSGATNIALLTELTRIDKKTDAILDEMNRAKLIATYYVLHQTQNKIKEDNKMKNKKKFNLGSKFSNRTKAIGAVTVLLAAGTAVSAYRDIKNAELPEHDNIVGVPELPNQIEMGDFPGIENALEQTFDEV